jgi:hypothetical protein
MFSVEMFGCHVPRHMLCACLLPPYVTSSHLSFAGAGDGAKKEERASYEVMPSSARHRFHPGIITVFLF